MHYIYTCGHKKFNGSRHDINVKRLCFDCRQKLIGTRQTVVRYGDLPKSGYSINYADNTSEIGVSVYFPNQTHRAEFCERERHTFSAIVIGYGSDDEPLIDASTIEEIK